MGYLKCPKCDGDGEVKCPKCGGSSFAHSIKAITNEMFGINEDEQCSRCHDKFVVACNECGGTGKVKEDDKSSYSKTNDEYHITYHDAADDYSSSSYSNSSTTLPSKTDIPSLIVNFVAIAVFVFAAVRIKQLVFVNVKYHSIGNEIGFFGYIEIGLELIFFLAAGAGILFLLVLVLKQTTSKLNPTLRIGLCSLIIIILTLTILSWLSNKIYSQV